MNKNLTTIIAALLLALVPAASAQAATKKSKVRFAATAYAAAENAGTATISVTRDNRKGGSRSATNIQASVRFSTSNGTAVAGTDYTATSGQLTFPACPAHPAAGSPCLVQTFQVPILDDALVDGNRTVKLALTSTTRSTVVVNPQKTTLTIADNEGPNQLTFDASDYRVWESDGQAEIHVIRSGAGISGSASATIATSNGTATAPGDYTAQTTALSYAGNEVDKTVLVDIANDGSAEPTESFNVGLSGASAGTTVGSGSTVTITDDDTTPGRAGFESAVYPVVGAPAVSEGDVAVITVVRTGSINSALSVDYATAGLTAGGDVDFASDADTIEFDAGDASATFPVSVLPDSLHEGDETFTVGLSNPMPATTALDLTSTTVTITDDDPAPTITTGGVTTGNGSVHFDIDLSNPSTSPVQVTYTITDADGNVVATGTATILAGSSGTSVDVPVSGTGPWTVTISNPTGGTIAPGGGSSSSSSAGTQNQGGGTDPVVTVTPGNSSGGDGNGGSSSTGGTTVSFDVSIPTPVDHPVTVDYTIVDAAGNPVGTGTVTIPAGQTTVTVTVPVPAGTGPVTIVLSNPTGATLTDQSDSAAVTPVTATAAEATTTAASATASATKPAAPQASQSVLSAGSGACGLKVKAGKRVHRTNGLVVTLKAARGCVVTLGASVKSTKKSQSTRVMRALKTKRQSITLKAGKAKTVKLRFTKRGLAFIKRALQARRPMTLTLAVIERDASKRVTKKTVRAALGK